MTAAAVEPVSTEKRDALRNEAHDLVHLAGEIFQVSLSFDEASVTWVLGSLIDFARDKPNGPTKEALMRKAGCFLGEAAIAMAGGEWVTLESGALAVRLGSGKLITPFEKITGVPSG